MGQDGEEDAVAPCVADLDIYTLGLLSPLPKLPKRQQSASPEKQNRDHMGQNSLAAKDGASTAPRYRYVPRPVTLALPAFP